MINGAMFVNLIFMKGGASPKTSHPKGLSPGRLLCVMTVETRLILGGGYSGSVSGFSRTETIRRTRQYVKELITSLS